MKGLWVLITCAVLLLVAMVVSALVVSYHRVVVLDGINGTPLPGAYVTLERSSGLIQDVGRTDDNGELAFWNSPFPLPRLICAQYLFYASDCVNAISLSRHLIELAVPAGTP
jgi:hypothetical protein